MNKPVGRVWSVAISVSLSARGESPIDCDRILDFLMLYFTVCEGKMLVQTAAVFFA